MTPGVEMTLLSSAMAVAYLSGFGSAIPGGLRVHQFAMGILPGAFAGGAIGLGFSRAKHETREPARFINYLGVVAACGWLGKQNFHWLSRNLIHNPKLAGFQFGSVVGLFGSLILTTGIHASMGHR